MAEHVVEAFDEVLRAIQALAALVDDLAPTHAAQVVRLAHKCCNSMDEVRRRSVHSAVSIGAPSVDGYRSPSIWLTAAAGMTRNVAAAVHRQSVDLCNMPASEAAALEGSLDQARIRQLTACYRAAPTAYTAEVDATFVELAADHTTFLRRTRAWLLEHKPARDEKPLESTLALFPSTDGYRRGFIDLTPDDGAIVIAALSHHVDRMQRAARKGDPAFANAEIGVLQASALVELCELELRRSRHGVHQHEEMPLLNAEPCLAEADGDPAHGKHNIDTGMPAWNEGPSLTILFRDKRCRFPGCVVPGSRCRIHPTEPAADGAPEVGARSGALLCRAHDKFVRRHGWRITFDDHGVARVSPPARPEQGPPPGATTAA